MKTTIKAVTIGLSIFTAIAALGTIIEYVGHLLYGWELIGYGYTMGVIFGLLAGAGAGIFTWIEDKW